MEMPSAGGLCADGHRTYPPFWMICLDPSDSRFCARRCLKNTEAGTATATHTGQTTAHKIIKSVKDLGYFRHDFKGRYLQIVAAVAQSANKFVEIARDKFKYRARGEQYVQLSKDIGC